MIFIIFFVILFVIGIVSVLAYKGIVPDKWVNGQILSKKDLPKRIEIKAKLAFVIFLGVLVIIFLDVSSIDKLLMVFIPVSFVVTLLLDIINDYIKASERLSAFFNSNLYKGLFLILTFITIVLSGFLSLLL